MFCARCGHPARATANFCVTCGFSLKDIPVGTLVDNRYRIEARIGGGAMGVVYKVWDLRLECWLALKVMDVESGLTDAERLEAVERFRKEAKFLCSLRHPGLPHVLDFFAVSGRHYLVQDLVQGENLEEILKREGKPGLPESQVRDMALEVLDILVYLHSQTPPVLYRDLKPANIMKRTDGKFVLIDFGIATDSQRHTMTAIGTEGYAPPEQYRGKVEPRSDLYALAATTHHLLTGCPPVPCYFEPLTELVPEIDPTFAKTIHRALNLNVQERFQGAAGMKSALTPSDTSSPTYPRPTSAFSPSGCAVYGSRSKVLKTLSFPRHTSLGRISARAIGGLRHWSKVGEARGEVQYPDDCEVQLDVYPMALKELQLSHLENISAFKAKGFSLQAVQNIFAALSAVSIVGVDLSQSQIDDNSLNLLKTLQCLEEVSLSFTPITDAGLEYISRELQSLRSLDLSGTAVTDLGLRHLLELPHLEELRLGYTGVTDDGLALYLCRMSTLNTLGLMHTKITDAGLQTLKKLASLRYLSLDRRRVFTKAGIQSLKESLPNLAVLR